MKFKDKILQLHNAIAVKCQPEDSKDYRYIVLENGKDYLNSSWLAQGMTEEGVILFAMIKSWEQQPIFSNPNEPFDKFMLRIGWAKYNKKGLIYPRRCRYIQRNRWDDRLRVCYWDSKRDVDCYLADIHYQEMLQRKCEKEVEEMLQQYA